MAGESPSAPMPHVDGAAQPDSRLIKPDWTVRPEAKMCEYINRHFLVFDSFAGGDPVKTLPLQRRGNFRPGLNLTAESR